MKASVCHSLQRARERPLLSAFNLERIIHSFMFSHLDFFNALFTCLSQTALARLQLVQNVAQALIQDWPLILHHTYFSLATLAD